MVQMHPQEISGWGDSRAWQIEYTPIVKGSDDYTFKDGKRIQNLGIKPPANGNAVIQAINPVSNELIIDPSNNVTMIMRAVPGTDTIEWVEKIKKCGAEGKNYMLPDKVFMHLGNDLALAAHRTKEDALRGCNTMDTGFIDDRHMETFRLTIDSLGGVR